MLNSCQVNHSSLKIFAKLTSYWGIIVKHTEITEIALMRILLCAATSLEIQPIINKITELSPPENSVDTLITGIGAMHTTYELTAEINRDRPDLVILAGIGGSFDPLEPPGEVYFIQKDVSADLGVRENNEWKDLFDMKLLDKNLDPYTNGFLYNDYPMPDIENLHKGSAVTVNQVTTDPVQILSIVKKYHPDVESMEGAAVHFVCLKEKIPFIHLRAVSNTIGQRNKAKWDIQLAVRNLNEIAEKIIKSIISK
jgi:futalosine hydrolase